MSASTVIKSNASITTPTNSLSSVTPKSCRSPRFHSNTKVADPYCIETALFKRGYVPVKCISSTLQGSIWKVTKSQSTFVVKVTEKALHKKNIAVVNGKEIPIQEDILKETAVQRYLSSSNPPKSLTTFESFFSDEENYFLVMQFGGSALFDFVKKCHQFIAIGKLTINEWQRFCKLAFTQMIELMDWMHNEMNCCHLDISLENFVIDNVFVTVDPNTDQIRFVDGFVIRIVDFGLAEVFLTSKNRSDDFQCSKYVGKVAYEAPKVYAKRVFDARAADIWSLGVVLFAMIIGTLPYHKPCKTDYLFRNIMSGNLINLLSELGRLEYVTVPIVHLMVGIFVKEKYRLNIEEIKNHPWFL